jgi:preprotein translocase subunit SecE
MLVGVWGCATLAQTLGAYQVNVYVQFILPALIVLGLAWVMFRYVINRPAAADFLIATEGEMKKVSWSSTKEVVGSTKVVIVTTFLLAALLFLVDFVFVNLFSMIGITG